MPDPSSQQFLRDLDKKLWNAADRLRANLDAAVYKHAVLGLIFLKYVSDSFAIRQKEIETALRSPANDYYLDPDDYGGHGKEEYEKAIHDELEERDYYLEKNVFWVPPLARWKTLQDNAPLPPGSVIEVKNGKTSQYKITSIGKLIDDALDAVEKENPKLKGVLNKTYTQLQLPQESLIGLINEIAQIPFEHANLHAKDILGHVYEYFLGQFAIAEGKKGGQYFTPKAIVTLIVEMLEPYSGRVYDPACGSGGFFVSSERFIEEHGGKLGQLSVYGQESNPTTWRLAAMNMAIRGIDFNFGKEPANSFTNDQHPDLRADFVMANPPFNISEWWDAKLEGDPRWKYGTPPASNANFAWLQHMLYHLAPNGSMALLLSNGSMSSNASGEGDIRRALVEADLVECMVALPGQLFTNTQIPACIWFLTKSKKARGKYRDRSGQTLFIDSRKLGNMVDRVLRDFSDKDIEKIAGTFRNWKRGTEYQDIAGFCKSAELKLVQQHDYALTPGRYVGTEEVEDDGESYEEKMPRLVAELHAQFAESEQLEQVIKVNLKGLGYHQFHGVREAVRVTLIAAATVDSDRLQEERAAYGREVIPGSRKAGVFWHTQGSGKSISMCCYAGKLLQQPEMNNPTLVVVTDRNDLDGQLYEQFCSAKDLLKQTPEQAESRDQLREMLAARQSGGIIFTTVQKFSLLDGEEKHPPLCQRNNVVVISDEAHRSQYGLKARLVEVKDKETNEVIGSKFVYGFAKHMRDALPGASFIGFTGTPIALEDKDTRGVFGDYVSIYDIEDAKNDNATVPIFYESRLAKLDINRAEIDELNRDVEEVVEDEEDVAARETVKSRWTQLAKLVGAKPRLKEVAQDLVFHFETRTSVLEGKAMFVAMSRQICVDLFDAIIKLRPQWAGTKLTKDGKEIGYNPEDGAIRIIMTGSASDKPEIQPHVFTKAQKKRLERRFKDPADPLKIVIVRDMWLTGFDAPCCHTMYVDKPMHGHNLMQAIARVNRVFKDKPGGLVVDYIGIAAELKKALRIYTDAKGKGQPTLDAHEALSILLEKMDVVRGMFHGFDYRRYQTDAIKLLVPAANHLLGLKDGKKRFLDVMASVTKAYSLCGTLDEAAALRTEIAFFSAIKAAIIKYTGL